ncbi:MAG: DUF4412 domain-containing protein [Chitinivibrionales bacterium]|nr:DUF4412 domain-containing protein [Chitinivibrionales bacterium]
MNPARNLSLIGLLSILLSLSFSISADYFAKHKQTQDAYEIMGRKVPASEKTVETWISDSKARMDMGNDSSIILDGDKKTVTVLSHASKSFMTIDLAEVKAEMNEALSHSGVEGMPEMMQSMMKFDAQVTNTGQKKKVKQWDCVRYDVEVSLPMGSTKSEVWASKSIEINANFYQKIKNFALLSVPGFEKMLVELAKIQGMPVLSNSETVVMGAALKSKEELLELKKKKAPAGTFAVPKGYNESKQ